MFTGLIETLGTVQRVEAEGAGRRLVLAAPSLASTIAVGDSLAINGACLTVVERSGDNLHFQAGPETLQRTNLGELKPGDAVNLERPLAMTDRLDGHFVQGHVDGIGKIVERTRQGDWELVWFSCSPELTAQMVSKGSVAVDGVSLTIVDVADNRFSVALIPHTLSHTTLGRKGNGDSVNIETDLLAKYVHKYLAQQTSQGSEERDKEPRT
jgi:riboflavin synthase